MASFPGLWGGAITLNLFNPSVLGWYWDSITDVSTLKESADDMHYDATLYKLVNFENLILAIKFFSSLFFQL